jgi:hypothetical protein
LCFGEKHNSFPCLKLISRFRLFSSSTVTSSETAKFRRTKEAYDTLFTQAASPDTQGVSHSLSLPFPNLLSGVTWRMRVCPVSTVRELVAAPQALLKP